eukprot:1115931-Amphidinium_carterae.1
MSINEQHCTRLLNGAGRHGVGKAYLNWNTLSRVVIRLLPPMQKQIEKLKFGKDAAIKAFLDAMQDPVADQMPYRACFN